MVALYSLGESSAINEIVRRYTSYIQTNCHSFVKDSEEAKDLTQEILIKLFLELPNFRKEARLKTWIYAITYHTCVDHLRKNKGRMHLSVSEKLVNSIPDLLEDEPENLTSEKSLELLENLLNQMTSEGRLILLMKYVEKQSIKDIQAAMGLSESAIKMRLKRARGVLNELYSVHRRSSSRSSGSE